MDHPNEPLSASLLDQLRRDAKRMAREQSLTHSQALDTLARQRGFQNWSLLVKNAQPNPLALERPPKLVAATARQVQAALGLPRMDASRSELKLIADIVSRLNDIVGDEVPLDRLSLMMDLEACHCNGCPLDLVSLLEAARDYDLVHDVMGIHRHLNRETGKLEDFFRPRYAARQEDVMSSVEG